VNDERPFERLATHAGPAEVDEAFGNRLYAVVQQEMRRPHPSMRRIPLMVAAVLAASAITGAVVVGSGLVDPPWVNRLLIPTTSPAASTLVEPTRTPMPSRRPSVGWTLTKSMIAPARDWGTATLLPDGTVLVAGGADGHADGSEPLSSAELFHRASGSWVATGSMLAGRIGQTATLLSNGMVLVAGGSSDDGQETALESVELYDPVTGAWTATGDMIRARSRHTTTLLSDGRVLVAGGFESAQGAGGYDRLPSAELYDPVTGSWTATDDMSQARDAHTATLLPDGRVLVAGGGGGGRLSSAELYDPVTGTWAATGDMTEPYLGHTATLLLDGTVLVAGGDAPSGPGARAWHHAELYDPVTGTWVATRGMITPRLGHTATLLADGRVLVTGGANPGDTGSAAELYDPVTGRWQAIGDMIQARSGHTATLLPDGRVLVVGGVGSEQQAAAELYQPGGTQ
jgi:N-acetylneuraminic acid mutarotase